VKNIGPPCSPSPEFRTRLPELLDRRVTTPDFRASLAEWRDGFQAACAKPSLRFVIWMATRRCNLRCSYCVLPPEESRAPDLTTAEVRQIFSEMAEDFDASRIMVGITGGEATMRPDLVEIVRHMVGLGFKTVAVDSNGVNYGRHPELLDRLVEAGMRCPTISVDGVGPAQRQLRGDRSAGELTWKAIEYCQSRYPDLGLTTICAASPANLREVPAVFDRFEFLGVRFARISPIFPLGRAARAPEDVLSPRDLARLMAWVAEQRVLFQQGSRELEIEFVDDGWCGLAWEGGMLRGNFLYCRAGVSVLGLEHDGRIVGCPVIHARFNTQGDARTERVSRVWATRFGEFRERTWLRQGACVDCRELASCLGGSMHNRDDQGRLTRCTKHLLEEGWAELGWSPTDPTR
jgi:radical SAM protein with 4Fe4S-binding SPASM domain